MKLTNISPHPLLQAAKLGLYPSYRNVFSADGFRYYVGATGRVVVLDVLYRAYKRMAFLRDRHVTEPNSDPAAMCPS